MKSQEVLSCGMSFVDVFRTKHVFRIVAIRLMEYLEGCKGTGIAESKVVLQSA